MYCRKCGEKSPDSAVYCRKCGEKIKRSPKETHKAGTPTGGPAIKSTRRKQDKVRCPNPHCNIRFTVREGQEKCHYCGASLFPKTKGQKIYCSICSKEIVEDKYYVIPPEKEGQKETYLHLKCVDPTLKDEALDVNYPPTIGYGRFFLLAIKHSFLGSLWFFFAVLFLNFIASLFGYCITYGDTGCEGVPLWVTPLLGGSAIFIWSILSSLYRAFRAVVARYKPVKLLPLI